MIRVVDKLREHQSPTPSKWREKAEYRRANKEWLRRSQQIAMMMYDKMEQISMTQTALATRMGCSQQYVSKVLKGTENLSIGIIMPFSLTIFVQKVPSSAVILQVSLFSHVYSQKYYRSLYYREFSSFEILPLSIYFSLEYDHEKRQGHRNDV
jgi:transcriptional regulator with XRE-family HTH domain